MLLRNLQSVNNDKRTDIRIENGKIESVSEHLQALTEGIEFIDAIVFPGLINSHDHLDFNLFPQLGNRKYNNYIEWGEDIHKHNKEVINKVLKVPQELRVQWGIYKNLLNGITTVVNHGPKLSVANDIITVWKNCYALHSVRLEKGWRFKLNSPFAEKLPFAIHVGEGTDSGSHAEINTLLKGNWFKRKVIGIHAIAMDAEQVEGFEAIVWCPDSNHFLLGKTAPIDKLKRKTNILFGTDSTVSAYWNLWGHLRLARQQNMATDAELFEMLTINPSEAWGMKNKATLDKGNTADLVVARKKSGLKGLDMFYGLNPEDILLVMHAGQIRLFDEELAKQLGETKGFSKVKLGNSIKNAYGDLPALINSIKKYYPEVYLPVETV
jgi:cytosine/adenosine deaminase-related metal-dependent hydrolase